VAESQIMTRAMLVLFALAIITPVTLAQQLPPPRNPAGDESELPPPGPALVPPQNAPQQAAQNARQQPAAGAAIGAQEAKKTPAQWRALFAARRRAENDRNQARAERLKQFKEARDAEEAKLYQDWHERYLADTPVRVEYYRALAAAYQSQPATVYYSTPYFYGGGPTVILSAVYGPVIYTPVYQPYSYGTFFYSRW
jgi:hypothetical protein